METVRARLDEAEHQVKKLLMCKELLVDISSRSVNLPADRIDREIENARHRICQFLELDRPSLWQIVEGGSEMVNAEAGQSMCN